MDHSEKIRPIDWLLVVGAIMAPMTGLRVWKIGPAEVLCFIWCICRLHVRRIPVTPYVKFFGVFLSSMLIGTFICSFVAPNELSLLGGWATWIYLSFIACTLFDRLTTNELEYNLKLLDVICRGCVIWYLFLYIYSISISRSFWGAPLWYYSRYTGGATNPHQVAVMLCGVAFWFSRKILIHDKPLKNAVYFAVAVYLERLTDSSTGTASIFVGIFISVLLFTNLHVKNKRSRNAAFVLEVLIGLLIAIVFRDVIYSMLYEWVSEDSNGLGRFYIWSSFNNMFVKSPIFGLGPGNHALTAAGNMIEFHNGYLELYAATGAAGFIAFIVLTVWIYKQVMRGDSYLLPIIVCLYAYSMAGFAFRRLAYWIISIFVIVISIQMEEKNNEGEMGRFQPR